jgi:hypothetical protein
MKSGLISDLAHVRGFFEGLNSGLYTADNITFDERCLDNNTISAII